MARPAPVAERRCGCGAVFTAGPYARHCPACRAKRRGCHRKYFWTTEREPYLREHYDGKVYGRVSEIGKRFGFPMWEVKRHATRLGLTHPMDRRDWAEEEEAFLWDHAGRRTPEWIAKKLERSLSSVILKFKRMRITRKYREGYTMRELELCFGMDHRLIDRWIKDGKLRAPRRPHKGPRAGYDVRDSDVLQFIKDHPMEFRLDKVDQFWFMDLITSGGLIRKALADERAAEGA